MLSLSANKKELEEIKNLIEDSRNAFFQLEQNIISLTVLVEEIKNTVSSVLARQKQEDNIRLEQAELELKTQQRKERNSNIDCFK